MIIKIILKIINIVMCMFVILPIIVMSVTDLMHIFSIFSIITPESNTYFPLGEFVFMYIFMFILGLILVVGAIGIVLNIIYNKNKQIVWYAIFVSPSLIGTVTAYIFINFGNVNLMVLCVVIAIAVGGCLQYRHIST